MMHLNLNRREKYYVAGAAAVIVLLLFSQLVISPIHKKRARLAKALIEKTESLQEMRSLEAEFVQLEDSAELAQSLNSKRAKNFNLSNFLTTQAKDLSIKITKMAPDEDKVGSLTRSTVDFRCEEITTEQLAKFLHKVECSGNNLSVRRMDITQTNKPAGYIDVRLVVETIVS
jgi:type II secretory pathway component PulM